MAESELTVFLPEYRVWNTGSSFPQPTDSPRGVPWSMLNRGPRRKHLPQTAMHHETKREGHRLSAMAGASNHSACQPLSVELSTTPSRYHQHEAEQKACRPDPGGRVVLNTARLQCLVTDAPDWSCMQLVSLACRPLGSGTTVVKLCIANMLGW